jgi:hypothetical protein
MRQSLHRRLRHLEELSTQVRENESWDDYQQCSEQIIKTIRLRLLLLGVEQEEHESLADTSARALGINSHELQARLASGVDPYLECMKERGIYDLLKRSVEESRTQATEEVNVAS